MGESPGHLGDLCASKSAAHPVRWRLLSWIAALAVLGAINAWVHADRASTQNRLLCVAGKAREHESHSQLVTTRCLALSQGLAANPQEAQELLAQLWQQLHEWELSHTKLSRAAALSEFSLDSDYTNSHARMHTVATAFAHQIVTAPNPVDTELLARDLLIQSDEHTIANEQLIERAVASAEQTDPASAFIRGGSIFAVILILYQFIKDSLRQTSQKSQAFRELEDLSSRQQRLLATMGHELRTPLASILGNAELLGIDNPEQHDGQRRVRTIRQNCNHLIGLIDGFLGETCAQQSISGNVLSCVRIADVVHEAVAICQNHADTKNIELLVAADSRAPEWIITDPLRLRQILLNLLGNAVRHTDKGHVRITFEGGDGLADEPVLIRVADTGCGISHDEIERIFEANYQSPHADYVGTAGLGLAISRELATTLGGSINVTSRLGVGSEFVVSLPRHLSFVVDNARPQAAPVASPIRPLEGKTIMLAEDDIDIQHVVGAHLRRAGADVIITGSGRTLIDHFTGNNAAPDLLLVDIHLEDTSGINATRTLRERGVTIPILSLSASDTAEDRAACHAAGCDAYLTKPIDAETLVSICTTWSEAAPQAA